MHWAQLCEDSDSGHAYLHTHTHTHTHTHILLHGYTWSMPTTTLICRLLFTAAYSLCYSNLTKTNCSVVAIDHTTPFCRFHHMAIFANNIAFPSILHVL